MTHEEEGASGPLLFPPALVDPRAGPEQRRPPEVTQAVGHLGPGRRRLTPGTGAAPAALSLSPPLSPPSTLSLLRRVPRLFLSLQPRPQLQGHSPGHQRLPPSSLVCSTLLGAEGLVASDHRTIACLRLALWHQAELGSFSREARSRLGRAHTSPGPLALHTGTGHY